MNYEEAVAYIDETPKFTTKNSLDHTRKCLERLGNPQNDYQVIHVAGTNGKGSVCAFMNSMLRAGNYRLGLFTSPHLIKINERFQINEVPVTDEVFLDAFHKVKQMIDHLTEEGDYHPTYFEMLFLIGMVIFQREKVEYVMLETGLGGRMDATNSIGNPMACVITSISLDHTEYLGDTIAKIAGEKAGIIKPGVPVIYDGNHREAARVIREQAEKLHAPAYEITEENSQILRNTPQGIDFSMNSEYYGDTIFHIPFLARYQVANGSLALKAMEVLQEKVPVGIPDLLRGMADTRWQGRMETVLPGVIVDGAHNEDGVARFIETVVDYQDDYEITLLFSAVADKDYQDMISLICEKLKFRKVYTTQIEGYRQVEADKLAEVFASRNCSNVEAISDIGQAFDLALKEKGEGLLFCVGSLYLVGEVKKHIREKYHD